MIMIMIMMMMMMMTMMMMMMMMMITSNNDNNEVAKCGRQRSQVKALLVHRCALRKFHVRDSQNTRDQITRDNRSKRA